jgi:hypothetical protein
MLLEISELVTEHRAVTLGCGVKLEAYLGEMGPAKQVSAACYTGVCRGLTAAKKLLARSLSNKQASVLTKVDSPSRLPPIKHLSCVLFVTADQSLSLRSRLPRRLPLRLVRDLMGRPPQRRVHSRVVAELGTAMPHRLALGVVCGCEECKRVR